MIKLTEIGYNIGGKVERKIFKNVRDELWDQVCVGASPMIRDEAECMIWDEVWDKVERVNTYRIECTIGDIKL